MLSMRLLHVGRVGDSFLLDHFDAGHFLDFRSSGGMGLVVAVVVPRPDVDEADRQGIAAVILTHGGVAAAAARQCERQEGERERPDTASSNGSIVSHSA